MVEDGSPLDRLRAALQEFAQHDEDEPVLVDIAVVVWEQTTIDETGAVGRRIRYAVPTDNFSPCGVLGLLTAADTLLVSEVLGGDDD